MIRRQARRSRRRSGAVAVIVALCLVPLVGIMAFAFDGGLMLAAKRRSQTVADASAHAAAVRIYANLSLDPSGLDKNGNARSTAFALAATNGYSNDGTTNTVQVNIPPIIGTLQNKPGYAYVEVSVTTIQPRIFSAVFGSNSQTIGAYAMARANIGGSSGGLTPYSNAAIITLDPSKAGALTVSGGVNMNADSPIQVNSSNVAAFVANNGVNVSAPAIQVTGNYTKAIGSIVTTTQSAAVQTGAPSAGDPLAALAAPNPTTLAAQSFQSTYGSATLNPGVYNGGLSLANGMVITMNPGVYYMKGGSFSVAGGVNVSGKGVTIYIENDGPADSFSFQGGANISLTPPTSGPFAGLSLFQDRTSTAPLNFANGSNVNIAGTIYAAGANMTLAGGSNTKAGSQLVVATLSVSNGVNLAMTTAADAKLGYVASKPSAASTSIVTIVQ